MSGKLSAAKRHRQSEVRRLRNKAAKSTVKTSVKKFLSAVEEKNKEMAEKNFKEMIKLLDTATRKGVFHKNTSARKKSRMHHLLNTMNAS